MRLYSLLTLTLEVCQFVRFFLLPRRTRRHCEIHPSNERNESLQENFHNNSVRITLVTEIIDY